MALSAIAVASAGASSGKPGLSNSLGVLANIFLLLAGRVTAAGDTSGRRQRKKGRPLPGLPFSHFGFDLLDLVRAAPSWERSLSDRSYALVSLIGMTCTNLRPSLPSRNATQPS